MGLGLMIGSLSGGSSKDALHRLHQAHSMQEVLDEFPEERVRLRDPLLHVSWASTLDQLSPDFDPRFVGLDLVLSLGDPCLTSFTHAMVEECFSKTPPALLDQFAQKHSEHRSAVHHPVG